MPCPPISWKTSLRATPWLAQLHQGVAGGAVLLVLLLIVVLAVLSMRLRQLQVIAQEKAREAEAASRAKSVFLLSMSHDIRTPMNAIIGFTHILQAEPMPPKAKTYLQKIDDSSKHLLTLLDDVLDLSRIESGKVRLAPVPVDINKVTDAVLGIADGLLADRTIRFEAKLEKASPCYVLADELRIREVLVNLLSNAVKFTKDGGAVTFEARFLPGADPKHLTARYCVKDTGIGIGEDFLAHLFDDFAQEESQARTQYKGSGLGLAISKHYVDMMGGVISVTSSKGKGSEFTVELPLETADAPAVTSRFNSSSNSVG